MEHSRMIKTLFRLLKENLVCRKKHSVHPLNSCSVPIWKAKLSVFFFHTPPLCGNGGCAMPRDTMRPICHTAPLRGHFRTFYLSLSSRTLYLIFFSLKEYSQSLLLNYGLFLLFSPSFFVHLFSFFSEDEQRHLSIRRSEDLRGIRY